MCCILTSLVFIGPRFAILIWWLIEPGRWERSFDTFVWPLLGFIFVPWTTLMYVLVRPGGITWFDWVLLIIAIFIDVSAYTGGGYGNRNRVTGYAR